MKELVIVTGLSGAGKSRAISALEDIGYYCVDNVAPILISKIVELLLASESNIKKVAIVTDSRGGKLFEGLFDELGAVTNQGNGYKLLYLEASESEIIRRYQETRRRHPLSLDSADSIGEAIAREKLLLKAARERADYIIDTTFLNSQQLKDRIITLFSDNQKNVMNINCVSFGFKYGPVSDADLVFDIRCLPNPFYEEDLRYKSGLDNEVRKYIFSHDEARKMLEKLTDLIDFLVPLYIKEGKSLLTVAFGCTGGRHRSVAFAEQMNSHLQSKNYNCAVTHRDIGR